MLYSTDRILTTHAGSLPRPPELRDMVLAKADPARAEPLVLMGECWDELHQPDKAKKSWEAAIKKPGGSAEAVI